MYAQCHAHIQVLRALYYLAVHFQQVRFFQRFKPEIVEAEVAIVNDSAVQQFGISFYHFHYIVSYQRHSSAGSRIYVIVQHTHRFRERFHRVFVQVAHRYTAGQQRIVGVLCRQRCCCFRCKVIQFAGGHTIVDTLYHFLGHVYYIHKRAKAVRQLFNTGSDLIKFDTFFLPGSFYYVHMLKY